MSTTKPGKIKIYGRNREVGNEIQVATMNKGNKCYNSKSGLIAFYFKNLL